MKKSTLFVLSILSLSSLNSFSQTIQLDTSFGAGGRVTTGLNLNGAGTKITLQSDGKIVAVGGNTAGDFVVARYNTDGSADNSFGTNGIVTTNFGAQDNASDVAIAPDGTIIVAGTTGHDFALAAYNSADGSLVSSFGNSGRVITDVGPKDSCKAVRVQGDGKIVVAGSTAGTTLDYALLRYNADGTLDNTFGTNGIVQTDFDGRDDQANALAIQADGKIVACGTSTVLHVNESADYSVARYNSDGSLDNTFATGGKLIHDYLNKNNYAYAIAISSNGRIVIAGASGGFKEAFPGKMGIFRLNSNGTIDATFNQDAIRQILFGSFTYAAARGVAINSDGKIYVSGYAFNTNSDASFSLIRLGNRGVADTSFGINKRGRVTTDFRNSSAFSYDIALQTDGKIVLGGFANNTTATDNNELALARYLPQRVTLPLDFVSFSLTKNQKSISLNWKVANEINNVYFVIERSNKGNTGFSEIGRVASKGNANAQQYTFEDLAPIVGGNFYRLKQVDADGHFTYSIIIYASFSKGIVIRLYPNPVTDKLTVDGLNEGSNATLSILNLQGAVMAKATTTNQSYNWNLKQIPAGTYFLRAEVDGRVTTLKFVKQ
jgi:uncharacterized delta-60 repeat protein